MNRRPLGLDSIDLAIQGGITVAIATAMAVGIDQWEDAVVAVGLTSAASLGLLALRRWWVLRKWRSEPVAQELVEHLEARLTELESVQTRLSDLEERLDFTERMLAQQREPDRLPEGRR